MHSLIILSLSFTQSLHQKSIISKMSSIIQSIWVKTCLIVCLPYMYLTDSIQTPKISRIQFIQNTCPHDACEASLGGSWRRVRRRWGAGAPHAAGDPTSRTSCYSWMVSRSWKWFWGKRIFFLLDGHKTFLVVKCWPLGLRLSLQKVV